jgi:hypothetical protein
MIYIMGIRVPTTVIGDILLLLHAAGCVNTATNNITSFSNQCSFPGGYFCLYKQNKQTNSIV